MTNTHYHIDVLMILLLVASAVAVVVKYVRLPYSIALVLVGLGIGVFHLLPQVQMTPELILLIFLPALLFEAAWNMDLRELKRNARVVTTFATIGVVISMLVVAGILRLWCGVDTAPALLFGAMIAATDPISVLALFRTIGMDKRLTLVLEGESLFNDGTAVVLFKLVLAAVLAGGGFSVAQTVGDFVMVVTGGALVGAMVGFAASRLTKHFDDHLLELMLTGIVAYGSFLLAEKLHVSAVIAVLAAGIVVGNYGSRISMSATTRLRVNSFWEYAAFVVNSLVFLLIGMQVDLALLIKYGPLIGAAVVAVVVARALVIYGLSPFVSTKRHPIPWSWRHVLVWGGVRGSLCMALALSLPLDFPPREKIVVVTFGVVLFTLLVQGLTMEPLVRLLGIARRDSRWQEYGMERAALMAEEEALRALMLMQNQKRISSAVFERIAAEIAEKQVGIRQRLRDFRLADSSIQEIESLAARKYLLEVRKDFLNELAREQSVAGDVVAPVLVDIDRQLDMLNREGEKGEQVGLHDNGEAPAAPGKADSAEGNDDV